MQSVLVVEDEMLVLFTIADELREQGFVVYEAANADQALVQLEKHKDISVLFTDIDMPGSMDGLRLSHAVCDRWPPVKIIITSGKHKVENSRMPSGGVFLPKPYQMSKVANLIQNLIG